MSRILLWSGIGLIVVVVVVTTVIFLTRRSPSPSQPKSTGPVTLTMWSPIDSVDVWQPIVVEYQREHRDVKIKYVQKSLASYELEAVDALATGKGPDIWAVNNSWLTKHRDKLVAAPEGLLRLNKQDKRRNESVVKASYVPIVAQEVVNDGKLYGLPMSVDTLALYTNTTVVGQRRQELARQNTSYDETLLSSGARTWDEFVNLVKLLTKKDGDKITSSAAAMGTAANNPRATDLLVALMLQNGTQMESPDQQTATFNLTATKSSGQIFNPGLNALDFYTSFALPTKETYTWNNDFPDAIEAFLANRVAIIPGYSWLGQILTQRNPEFQYRVMPLPQIRGSAEAVDFANYWLETVSNNSKSPEAAWDFIKFATTQGLTLYQSSTNRPSPKKPDPGILPQNILSRNFVGNPFRFQTMTAKSWYRGLQPAKVEQALADMIEDVVTRTSPSENALNKAAKTVTEIFRATAKKS